MVAERAGLGIEVKNMKGNFSETKRSLAAHETLADMLAENWGSQPSEGEERRKSRVEELLTIHETIKLLIDDDALELFKATLQSASSVQDAVRVRVRARVRDRDRDRDRDQDRDRDRV